MNEDAGIILAAFAIRENSTFLLKILCEEFPPEISYYKDALTFTESLAEANYATLAFFAKVYVIRLPQHQFHLSMKEEGFFAYYIWKGTKRLLPYLHCLQKMLPFSYDRILNMLVKWPQCEEAIVQILQLFNPDTSSDFSNSTHCRSFLKHLCSERNVNVLKELSKYRLCNSDMLHTIKSFHICYREPVIWRGIHVMRVVQVLMDDFGMKRDDMKAIFRLPRVSIASHHHVFVALHGGNA
eukprot:6191460-Pleurochrysis_carterae.AAC.1